MEPRPEEMISWVLEELSLAADEGICISQVFNQTVAHLSSNASTLSTGDSIKDQLWRLLTVREDVTVGDGTLGPTLKKLMFNEVLLLGLGETIVRIRKIRAPPNGHPAEGSPGPQPRPQPTVQTEDVRPEKEPENLESAIEVHTPQSPSSNALVPPSTLDPSEAILSPTASTPPTGTVSLQPPDTPSSQLKTRRPYGSGANRKTPQRKTDRRWTLKPIFTPQEQVDLEEEEAKLEKGMPGVYSNLFDRKRSIGPNGGRRRDQRILVFKSDRLMDPQWLDIRRGTWVERYLERKAEYEAWCNDQVEQNRPTPRKRRLSEVSIPGSVNRDSQPPKKRGHPYKSIPSTDSPGTEMATTDLPITQLAARFGARQSGTYTSPWSSQTTTTPQVAQDSMSSSQVAISQPEYHSPFSPNRAMDQESRYLSPSTSQTVVNAPGVDRPALTPQEAAQKRLSPRDTWNQTNRPKNHEPQSSYPRPQAIQFLHPAIRHSYVQQADAFQNSADTLPKQSLNSPFAPANIPQHAPTRMPPAESFKQLSSQYQAHEDMPHQPPFDQSHSSPSRGRANMSSGAHASPHWTIDAPINSSAPNAGTQVQSNDMAPSHPAETQTDSHPESAPTSSLQQPASELLAEPQYPPPHTQLTPPPSEVNPLLERSFSSLQTQAFISRPQTQNLSDRDSPQNMQNHVYPPRSDPVPYPTYNTQQYMAFYPGPQSQDAYGFRSQSVLDAVGEEHLAHSYSSQSKLYEGSLIATVSNPLDQPGELLQHVVFPRPQSQNLHEGHFLMPHVSHDFSISPAALSKREYSEPSTTAPSPNLLASQSSIPRGIAKRRTQNKAATPKPAPLPRLPRAELEIMEKSLENMTAVAEAIPILDATARMVASCDGVVGNLFLSGDKSMLIFSQLVDEVSPHTLLSIEICRLTEDPIVSQQGSRPMELRIKYKCEDDESIETSRFYIGQTDAAFQAASIIRSKIANARIAARVKSGETDIWKLFQENNVSQIEVIKPYHCEQCGSRFKNKEGIKYHLSKSNTPCNPNFVPKSPKPAKPPKPHRKKTPQKPTHHDKTKKVVIKHHAHPGKQDDLLPPTVEEGELESDSSSEDSIYEWAEKVAFVHPGDQPKSTQNTPKKARPKPRQLPVEEDVLKAIMEDAALSAASCWTQTSPLFQTPDTGAWDSVATGSYSDKIGLCSSATSDEVSECSKDIILSLINRNHGLFPGDKGLWFAFVASWLQRHAGSGILPLSGLYSEALDQLVQDKKLSIASVPIQRDDPMAPVRTIVTLPTLGDSTDAVEKLKELIQFSYPSYYVPSKFAPASSILTKLQQLTEASQAQKTPSLESGDDEHTRKRRRMGYGRANSKSRRQSHSSDYSPDEKFIVDDDDWTVSDEGLQDEDEDEDSDDLYEDEETSVEKYRQIDMIAYEKANTRERQAMRMKARWAAAKAFGSNNIAVTRGDYQPVGPNRGRKKASFTPTGTPTSNLKRPNFGWKGPLTVEERLRRANLAARRLQVWNQPLVAPLQNPDTGAWNQKPHRAYNRRHQLPEVLTFMQSENGAWNVRPRGHGAKPIHSRPSRRADGNPHLPNYLSRLEKGHRPVTEPTKKRLFLPANPSKVLLKNPQLPVDPKADVQTSKRQYRSRKRKVAESAEHPDDLKDGVLKIEHPNPKRRKFRKRKSSPHLFSDLDAGSDYELSPSDVGGTSRTTQNSIRTRNGVDPIQDLNFFRPRSSSDINNDPNPGLDSLPATFGHRVTRKGGFSQGHSTNASVPTSDPFFVPDTFSLQDILSQVQREPGPTLNPVVDSFDRVAAWEQGPAQHLLYARTSVPNIRWINHTIDFLETSFDTETIQLKWFRNASFTVEDFPYEELDYCGTVEDVEPVAVPEKPKPQKRRGKPALQNSIKESQKTFKRRLTSLATDIEGFYDNVEVAAKEFNVQVATNLVKLGSRSKGGTLSVEEENRFLLAVIIIRALTGGIPEAVDWVLVVTLFPKCPITYLKKVWIHLGRKKKTFIEKLTSDFQQAFISAYEKGEVPPINYDDLVSYDWAGLTEWAAKTLNMEGANTSIRLPGSHNALKRMYDMSEQASGEQKSRESFFSVAAPNYKRNEAVSAIPHTLPAMIQPDPKTADDININEWTLAKSLIRATVFTPNSDYRHDVAKTKLASFDKDLCSEVIKELIHDRVIVHRNKGRAVPERAYEPTDNVSAAFKKQSMQEKQFIEAVQFKKFLDSEFASGKPFVRSDYMANEGTVMCVTSLQAHGRIRLQAIGVPMNKFGLTDGGYETRKLPKERFRFDMDIHPTDSYLYDSDNLVLQGLDKVEIPRGGETRAIPLWYGISDVLIPEMWRKVLVSVAGVTAMRSGINIALLEEIFRPSLETWEIWRLMEWGVAARLFERPHPGWEGWMTSEWWWAIVGRMCEKHMVDNA